MWIGSLLVISSLMALVPEQVGAAREATVLAARRLFNISANGGAMVTVLFGGFAIIEHPEVLRHGWMHAKLALVVVLLFFHALLYRRIAALADNPGGAARGQFSMIHGAVSLLLLAILALVILKPF